MISFLVVWGIASVGLARKALSLAPQAKAILSGDYNIVVRGNDPGEVSPDLILQAANFVRSRTAPSDLVLVWSRHSHILYLAERRSSTHFSNIGMLISVAAISSVRPTSGSISLIKNCDQFTGAHRGAHGQVIR